VIASDKVKVNKTIGKPSTKLRFKDNISFGGSLFKPPTTEIIELPIIYEDSFCLVLDKPSGIITHSKGSFSSEGSVASFARNKLDPDYDPDQKNNRAGIVHRLDRGTSGVIIVAKSAKAQKYLSSQFAKRIAKKTYYALVSGKLAKSEAIINMPIERDPKHPAKFRPGPNGRSALSQYVVVATNDKYSLLKVTPETGRTHQIRVHLKAINHPVVGDIAYGGDPADRLMLHASSLLINLPNSKPKTFSSPLPKEFLKFIKPTKLYSAYES
ncbi:MAG: RluA family pseudouridine synthase, partial [Candidatus Saccharimonadales bacterium]